MNKADLRMSLLLSLLCFVSGFFVLPYQLENLSPQQIDELLESVPFTLNVLAIITSVQLFVMAFLLSFFGLKLARKTGFSVNILDAVLSKGKIAIDKKSAFISVVSGIVIGLIIVGADRFYYQYQVPIIGESKPEFSFFGLMAGVLYGGIFEEILMRLFFMSLLVWIFMKVFKRNKENISSKFYWIAIFLSSALFAAGHLPATEMFFGELTATVVVRGFLLNGMGGLVFGYLYWKRGLEYAILAHMFAHISMQLIFIPIFY